MESFVEISGIRQSTDSLVSTGRLVGRVGSEGESDRRLAPSPPCKTTITLKHVIRAKRNTLSQVYKGSLRIGSGKPRAVCVKIYQQSLCSLPSIACFDETDRYNPELRTARHNAGVEAWAYCKLAPLQGMRDHLHHQHREYLTSYIFLKAHLYPTRLAFMR